MRIIELKSPKIHREFSADPCSFLYSLAKAFPGENIELDLGNERLIAIQSMINAEQILVANENRFQKNFGSFNLLFGLSRLTADNPSWQKLQRLSQPYIARVKAEEIHAASKNRYSSMAEHVLSLPNSTATDIAPILDKAAAQILFDLVFGYPLEILGDLAIEDLQHILRYSSRLNWTITGYTNPDDRDELNGLILKRQHLATKLSAWLAAEEPTSQQKATIFKDFQANSAFLDVVSETISLAFAGYDTTSTSIGWALFLLSIQPNLVDALRAELKEFGHIGPSRLNDFYNLPLMDGFFHETLRIFPPVPILSRIAIEDFELDQRRFYRGQKIIISVIGIHHDENSYENPSVVNVKRWRDSIPLPTSYLPFGMGRRRCGGALFGEREFKSAIATPIEAIDIEPVEPLRIKFDYIGTLRRIGGQRFKFIRFVPKKRSN